MQEGSAKKLGKNFRWLKIICIGFAAFFCVPLIAVLIFAFTLPPLDLSSASERSVVVLDRSGRLLRPFTTAQGRWRLPVDERYLKLLIPMRIKDFTAIWVWMRSLSCEVANNCSTMVV
jgi:penicillin-binding protein 1C